MLKSIMCKLRRHVFALPVLVSVVLVFSVFVVPSCLVGRVVVCDGIGMRAADSRSMGMDSIDAEGHGDSVAAMHVTLIDEAEYIDLVPGRQYEIRGVAADSDGIAYGIGSVFFVSDPEDGVCYDLSISGIAERHVVDSRPVYDLFGMMREGGF